jgi:magnesium chelatase subunit I
MAECTCKLSFLLPRGALLHPVGMPNSLPASFGALKQSAWGKPELARRGVRVELRRNLIQRLSSGEKLFPGIHGYDDTVIPQIVNAVLSQHHFILLGLRGQAKTRLIRMLTTLMDPAVPYIAGSEIRDNPFAPLSQFGRQRLAEAGDDTPISWLQPGERYVEKLATPDVTIADMIGDIDPIKAARLGQNLGDELTVHYGLLPRANRGIFAVNELPDLAGRIQVGLFNILQEGDIQIKGYPVRLPLDLLLVFTANPEDYTARGRIITPLKDRIGSEIRTHYPLTVQAAMSITEQESWTKRDDGPATTLPEWIRESIEHIAFLAREDKRVDKKSGVSQRLPVSATENVQSGAERRALMCEEKQAVARVADLYSALPSITGKLELEYEGELRGGEQVARDLVRAAVARAFQERFDGVDLKSVVAFFEKGGAVRLSEDMDAATVVKECTAIPGLMEKTSTLGLGVREEDPLRASAAEFILEGLHAMKRIGRNEELGFVAGERKANPPASPNDRKKQYQ